LSEVWKKKWFFLFGGNKINIFAFISVPFYRYGEIGNICYTSVKNILDDFILYTMFSRAEQELKVAVIRG